ncbi:Inositolphosphorylceramide synthase subunit Kei1-domain-containing protein [Xylogone sp. PMI_703]|nr:Inositolphosphorylceramide synthase subunit Kei1-domain-containing protein [Xylogone sp. PMI_703]
MAPLSRYLRLPRPTRFLYFLSLRTGTEMISLSMIFNKLSGFYGLLAVLTGLRLSPLQLSMYIYSLVALVLLIFLMPHIRKQSPFECLALAWFYLIDTVVNTAFTAAFAVTWFLAVSAQHTDGSSNIPSSAPGSGTIEQTAGFNFTKPDASTVDVTAVQDVVAPAAGASPSLGHAVGIEESVPSIIVVVILTLIRVYFIFVVMAYAKQVIRHHSNAGPSAKMFLQNEAGDESPVENPFAVDAPLGEGWRGKVGRVMVKIGEGYWLERQADDSWSIGLEGRFRSTKPISALPHNFERERRARSGTGPPPPPLNLGKV